MSAIALLGHRRLMEFTKFFVQGFCGICGSHWIHPDGFHPANHPVAESGQALARHLLHQLDHRGVL